MTYDPVLGKRKAEESNNEFSWLNTNPQQTFWFSSPFCLAYNYPNFKSNNEYRSHAVLFYGVHSFIMRYINSCLLSMYAMQWNKLQGKVLHSTRRLKNIWSITHSWVGPLSLCCPRLSCPQRWQDCLCGQSALCWSCHSLACDRGCNNIELQVQ